MSTRFGKQRCHIDLVVAIGFLILALGAPARGDTEITLLESDVTITVPQGSTGNANLSLSYPVGGSGTLDAAYGVVGRETSAPAGAQEQSVGPVLMAQKALPGAKILSHPVVAVESGVLDWSAEHAPDRLIVCFHKNTTFTQAARTQYHQSRGTAVRKHLRMINADVIQLPAGASLRAVAKKYAARPEVAFVQPDFIVHANELPDDEYFPHGASSLGAPDDQKMWGLHTNALDGVNQPPTTVFDMDIDTAEAWEITTGSSSVVVAVIDSGVDYNHEDLAANMWVNTGETPGNGLDDDGNGYIDDVYGYDFVNDDGDPMDDNNHGTHVSGTIGGVGNNGIGVAGVVWTVRIMALKFLGASGSGWTSDAVRAADYAVANGALISNNSWGGGGFNPALQAAIAAAQLVDHVFVASAGNDNRNTDDVPKFPASLDNENIISVAAMNPDGSRASFSNYGIETVDLTAPGVDIWSAKRDGGYLSMNGTSMSGPHVAGVAALLRSVRPDSTFDQVKQWILDGVTPMSEWNGLVLSGGRLDAAESLRLATMPWLEIGPPSEGIVSPSASRTQARRCQPPFHPYRHRHHPELRRLSLSLVVGVVQSCS